MIEQQSLNFLRVIHSEGIKLIGETNERSLFDLRFSMDVKLGDTDFWVNPFVEKRYMILQEKDSPPTPIVLKDEMDIFRGSASSYPDLSLMKLYS